jgi:hypothetical protein
MTSTKKRLLILELEARRRRAEILQRSRRGQMLLRIEHIEREAARCPTPL